MSGDLYKNKTRIRVNGLLIEDDAILLARIKSPVTDELIWMPPGGGLEFGETMHDCLCREFREESGLQVEVGSLVAINEMLKPPFHAIEMYFTVQKIGGELELGHDPEHDDGDQVLKDLQWIPLDELDEVSIAPEELPGWMEEGDTANVFYKAN